MSELVLEWEVAPMPLDLEWAGPDLEVIFGAQHRPTPMVAAVFGPPGEDGEQGPPGSAENYDPGDLTLIFENKLI